MRTRTRMKVAGLVFGVALAGGVAFATGAIGGGTSVITACQLMRIGTIRIVDSASACSKHETAISWNQQGVAGAIGAVGPQGPKGDAGPAGADGAKGAPGATGAQGIAGDKGAIGPQGPVGPKGDTGATGASGPQGPAGPAGPGGGPVSLGSLDGTPCGAPNGTPGVTKVTYATGVDSDAISITCNHVVPKVFLDVFVQTQERSYSCGFPVRTCYEYSSGVVSVSPTDLNGKSSCSPQNPSAYTNPLGPGGFLCFFAFPPGTNVTVTASSNITNWYEFAGGWHQPVACVGTSGPVCVVAMNGHHSVGTAFGF
jgi:hypothetical protein